VNIYGKSPKPAKSWLSWNSNSFIDIQNSVKIPSNWRSFQKVLLNEKYTNSILKPINNYVLNLYPKPELISYTANKIVLRQRTHAEIWVYKEKDYLYVLDRPHQRQLYPSSLEQFKSNELVFEDQFRFYIPWIFDKECSVSYVNVVGEETPFFIFEKEIKYSQVDRTVYDIDTDFIPFYIYKNSEYRIDKDYGIIKVGTAMYDIIIEDIELVDLIRKCYE
jgi:hypothetical protein